MIYYFNEKTAPLNMINEGVNVRIAYGENIMMSFVYLAPETGIAEHSHSNEQMGCVISGEVEFTIGGQRKICRAGELYYAPPNVPHGSRALNGVATVLDILSPPRSDLKQYGTSVLS